MALIITITDTKHNYIYYETNPLMARVTSKQRPLHISSKLLNIFEQLPCGYPKNNWENKKLSVLTIQIQQSLTKLYHHPQYYEFYDDTDYYDEYFYDIYLGEYGANAITSVFCFFIPYANALCMLSKCNLSH